MTRQLTAHNATVSTAAVEIRTLTISGKQVTLAVFRQLRNDQLVADDGTLNGVPWGIVNYHPDKCGDDIDHWHIVWQRGEELLRSFVRVRPEWLSIETHAGNRFINYCVAHRLAGGNDWFCGDSPWEDDANVTDNVYCDKWRLEPWCARLRLSPAACEAAIAHLRWRSFVKTMPDPEPEWHQQQRANVERRAKKSLATLTEQVEQYGSTGQQLHEQYVAETQAAHECRKRHIEVRRTLADLPQLFIAV